MRKEVCPSCFPTQCNVLCHLPGLGFFETDAETFLLVQSSAKPFNSLASTVASIHRAWKLREVCSLICSRGWGSTVFHSREKNILRVPDF